MDQFKKYLLPLIFLTLFVSFILGFRSFLIANIIEPIALMFWAIWRLITSVDQNTYWIILILFCIISAIYFVASGKQKTPSSAYHETNNLLNRVEYWQKLIKEASLGRSEKEYLQDSLRDLFSAANSQMEKGNSEESADRIAQQKEDISDPAYRFLDPAVGKNGKRSSDQLDLLSFMPKWLRRWVRKTFYSDHALIDEILHNMENKLEINNEK